MRRNLRYRKFKVVAKRSGLKRDFAVMRLIILFMVIIFSGGCAKLAHLDQLLTLKAVSEEQGSMDAYVEKQDKKFRALLQAVQDKSIEHYSRKE